jgi:hypothetical protein
MIKRRKVMDKNPLIGKWLAVGIVLLFLEIKVKNYMKNLSNVTLLMKYKCFYIFKKIHFDWRGTK